MFSTFTDTQKGIFLSLIGFTAYAFADASAKWLTIHYSVLQVIAWTYFCALIFCIVCAPWLGGIKCTLQTKKLKIHIARGLCNVLLAIFAVLSFSKLPLTSVYTIFFLAPFVITLLAIPLYKEHVDKKHWLVITLGFCGVLVAFPPGPAIFNPWVLMAFAATFFIAILGLLARPLGKDETILSLCFYPSLANTLVLLPFTLQDMTMPPLSHLAVFMLTGIMITLGLSCVAHAFRTARHAVVAPLHYTQIVWGIVIGYVLFGDIPALQMLLGAAIIIGSGIYLIETERRNGQ
jgi:drug/metabolite transporter (DMT)-like permease